jgi:putative phosphotransacetylase
MGALSMQFPHLLFFSILLAKKVGHMKTMLPIARSDIHVHLTQSDLDALFGENYKLTYVRELTIPGNYACAETLEVVGPKGSIKGAVIVAPVRKYTQVEVSFTDAAVLGLDPPLRESGDLEGSPGCILIGSNGRKIVLEKGVIAALRHIHMHPDDAKEFGVVNGQRVKIRVPGERALVFENVIVRVSEEYRLEMHIDMDEGRAAKVVDFQLVELIR